VKASTIERKLRKLEEEREALQERIQELEATAAGVMDPKRQRELLDQKEAVQRELAALDRAIEAGKVAHKGALEAEAQAAARKWREELLPKAQVEIQEARAAVVESLKEARTRWNQLRKVEQKWRQEWERLGSPPPPPKTLSGRSFQDFLVPNPTDREMREILR